MGKRSKFQYLALALGWVFTGLVLILSVGAVFSPGHKLVLDFNRFGELWVDLVVFVLAFGLMTWLLFFKLPKSRRTDRKGPSGWENKD